MRALTPPFIQPALDALLPRGLRRQLVGVFRVHRMAENLAEHILRQRRPRPLHIRSNERCQWIGNGLRGGHGCPLKKGAL